MAYQGGRSAMCCRPDSFILDTDLMLLLTFLGGVSFSVVFFVYLLFIKIQQ